MRPTTDVFAKFESKGRPKFTETHQTDVGALAKLILQWLLRVEMGHKLVITIGRDQLDIERVNDLDFLSSELDDLLNQADLTPDELLKESVNSCPHQRITKRGIFMTCEDCGQHIL